MQVAGFGGPEEPHLHAELQHPAMMVGPDDPVPALPESVERALAGDGWQQPQPARGLPNFWCEVPIGDAEVLALRIMRALMIRGALSPAERLRIEGRGPTFGD